MATLLINSVSPTTNPYVKQPNISHAPRLHSLPQNRKFPINAESGRVSIPREDRIFELPKWNGSNQLDEAAKYFEDMVGQGYKPDASQANQLVSDLCKWRRSQKARSVIALIVSSGCCTLDPSPCITLMSYLCKFKLLRSAAKFIDRMEENGYSTNISMYNILVKELIVVKQFKLAWKFVHRMFQQGIMPTSDTYSIMLEGVCMESGIDEAMRLFDYLNSSSRKLKLCSYKTLLTGFCAENRVDDAIRFFRTWPSMGIDPDHVSYEILVKDFCLQGRWMEAKELLVEMEETGRTPTKQTYSMLVSVLAHHGRTDYALGLIEEMVRKRFEPDVITYNTVIKHLSKQRKVGDVAKCVKHMRGRNCQPTIETYNAVAVLCEVGMVRQALAIIESFDTRKNFDSRRTFYRYVLKALCKLRNAYPAFHLLHAMTERGFTPDEPQIFKFLLRGLCSEKTIGAWLQVSEMMIEEGYDVIAKDYSPFLHVLCNSGRTEMALEVFRSMIEKGCMPSESTYTIIVHGLVLEEEIDLASLILKELYLRQLVGKKLVERLLLQYDLKDFVQENR